MSPTNKTLITTLAMIIAVLTTLGCVTVTSALNLDDSSTEPADINSPNEEIAEPEYDDSDEIEESGYWDDFKFDADDRPILSGEEIRLETEHFIVHYTLSGRDAVSSSSYADEVGKALEYSWQVQIDQFGWAPPPPDLGIGGDDRYDVYIQNIFADGTAGYTEGGEERYRGQGQGVIGDNPRTEAIETRAAASYIVIDNDYAELDEWALEDSEVNTLDLLDAMRSTVAHEFNHALQFGYDGEEPADWLWEATATWMQDEVYDEINDANEDLLAVFKSPDTCQLAYGGEERVEDDNHWYGEWIFIRYISEQHGHQTIREIWEHARDLDGYAAIEAALGNAGTSLDKTFVDFSIALLTRNFDEGQDYPILRLEGSAQNDSVFVPNDGTGQMAADYVEILADGLISVKLDSSTLTGKLVGIQSTQASVFPMEQNQATVDTSQFDHLYLIAINLEQAKNEYKCESETYSVNITSSSLVPDSPIPNTYPAPNFQPPQVEPLLDPEEYWGEGWDEWYYEEVEPPAELIPAYLPADYELIEAYLIEASDYEYDYDVDLIWYIPGEGTATVIDFYGPGQEDFIDITISESPYTTLSEWLDAADYEPYDDELVTFNGVNGLLEDYTDEYGPYAIATFIADGQFIVMEGTISPEEMSKVVESLPILP